MTGQTRGKDYYRRMLESLDALPGLPEITARLIRIVNSVDTSAEDAAKVIEKDPALTGKMLRLANSAFYGMPRTIPSVSSAVVILGFNTIRSLALSATVMKLFGRGGDGDFDYARFWRHSIVCAITAKSIARGNIHTLMLDPEGAFCTGILHDIGKLIFARYTPKALSQACAEAVAQNLPALEAENRIMGVDHCWIGRLVADRWALPIELENALVHHHDPQKARHARQLVTLVHLADYLCHDAGVSCIEGEAGPPFFAHTAQALNMGEQEIESCRQCVAEAIEKCEELYAILRDER